MPPVINSSFSLFYFIDPAVVKRFWPEFWRLSVHFFLDGNYSFVSSEGSGSSSNHNLDLSLGNSSSKQNSHELAGEVRNLAVDQQHNSVPFEITFRDRGFGRNGYNESETMQQLLSQTHIQSPNSVKANGIMRGYGQFDNRGEPPMLNMVTSQLGPSNFQVSIKNCTQPPTSLYSFFFLHQKDQKNRKRKTKSNYALV